MEYTKSQSYLSYFGKIVSDTFYKLTLIFLAFFVFFLLIVVKSKTVSNFLVDPIFFTYSILITIFAFSRIISASLYRASNRKLLYDPKNNKYEPPVSFIIPCKDEEKVIERTVKKCFLANYPISKKEVIVINDGSTDGTQKVLNKLKQRYNSHLKIIRWHKNRGKRNAMTAGIKIAKGEIIIQIDSDSYIDPLMFRNIIVPFEDKNIGAVSAHVDPSNADKNILTKMQAAYYNMSFRILKAAESAYYTVFCCSGAASAYRKSAIISILDKWRNEKFMGLAVTWGDDRSLTGWVLKKGFKTIYTDYVRAYTDVPETPKKLLLQQLRWKKSWIVNAIFTFKFIFVKQPFVAWFYFLPLTMISFFTPFILIRAMIYSPLVYGYMPIYYLVGLFLITSLVIIFYRIFSRENKYWPYLYLWAGVNIIIFAPLMIYATLKLKDRGWGTR